MNDAETRYETHNAELLAIVAAFKQWSHYLEGSQTPIVVKTDHDSLRHFFTKKALNRRQARWAEKLAAFDFTIEYRTGKTNPADGLSRKPSYKPSKDSEELMLPTLQRKLQGVFMTRAYTYRDTGEDTAFPWRMAFTAMIQGQDVPMMGTPNFEVAPQLEESTIVPGTWSHHLALDKRWGDMPPPIVGSKDALTANVYALARDRRRVSDGETSEDSRLERSPLSDDSQSENAGHQAP